MNASIRPLLALTLMALSLPACAATPRDAWSARSWREPQAAGTFWQRDAEQTTTLLRAHERSRSGRGPLFLRTPR